MKFLGSEPPQCCTQTAVFTTFYRDGCEATKNCCYLCGNVMTIQGHCKVHLCPKKEVIVNQYQVILSCCCCCFEVGFHLRKTYILVYCQPEITA